VLKTTLSRCGEGCGIACDILVKGRPCTDDLPFISSKTFQDRCENAVHRFLMR